jgi:hypothetical protein
MNDHYKRRSHEREIREQNGAAAGPAGSKYDDPPNSRLFIVCGKSITEEDFKESFEPYGVIEEIWVLRDKAGLEKTRFFFFFFLNPTQCFFLYICPEESFFRVCSVSRIRIGASRL